MNVQAVDRAVLAAARYPLRFVNMLRSRGLVQPLGGLGTLSTAYYKSSEMTPASVTMSSTPRARQDLPELKQVGVRCLSSKGVYNRRAYVAR